MPSMALNFHPAKPHLSEALIEGGWGKGRSRPGRRTASSKLQSANLQPGNLPSGEASRISEC
eukprot:14339376-Alexandrium_andersonii.AAC.1